MKSSEQFDVAIVGSGVFGSWLAYLLVGTGASVALVDAYGPANSRASSGGESRIIRLGYGPDKLYTRSAQRSLVLWHKFFAEHPQHKDLFKRTGVLWLVHEQDDYSSATLETLHECKANVLQLDRESMVSRYPQLNLDSIMWGILEPDSGVLMARRAVQAVAAAALENGVSYFDASCLPPSDEGVVTTTQGETVRAAHLVFACGPWLPKVFPYLLSELIHVTRQEVFFLGTEAADDSFSPERLPAWIDFIDLVYALPDLEHRGFKIAIDAHGPDFDPDEGRRVVTTEGLDAVRRYLAIRVPQLRDAPVLETRVCQYENTSNGDFLIDRHPDLKNVWIVGGGSGHGFKHGPAVAEYLIALMRNEHELEPRFSLATKETIHKRSVF